MSVSSTAKPSHPPLRFVLQIKDGRSVAWRIVVRGGDAELVRRLAADGDVIASDRVIGWFAERPNRWPPLARGSELDKFVTALNVLRVTLSRSVKDLQNRTPEQRTARVKQAIETLATDLPAVLAQLDHLGNYFRYFGLSTMKQINRLTAVRG